MTAALDRAQALLAARPELADTILLLAEPPATAVRCAEDAHRVFAALLAGRETEAFAVAALDRRNWVIESAILTTGTPVGTMVDAAQVLRWVLTRSKPAAAFLVAHNHPSGDPEPSAEDRMVTKRLRAAADAVGLALHDHLVLGAPGSYTSFALHGLFG